MAAAKIVVLGTFVRILWNVDAPGPCGGLIARELDNRELIS